MSALDLYLSRKALAAGVGLTTRRNKVLAPDNLNAPIPARTGLGRPKKNTVSLPTGTRTFVFKIFGASSGVIANKHGAGLVVLVRDFLAGVVSYAIGALKTDGTNKWYDVLRLAGTAFRINGLAPVPVVPPPAYGAIVIPATLSAAYGATALPWVGTRNGAYVATMINSGDYIRSSLFAGIVDSATRKVVSFGSSGYPRAGDPPWNFTYSYAPSNGHLAGLRLTPGGKFHSYAARYFTFASPGNDSVSNVQAMRSTITASLAGPYISGPDNSAFIWTRYLNPPGGYEYTTNYIAYETLTPVSHNGEIHYIDADAATSSLTVGGVTFPAHPPTRIDSLANATRRQDALVISSPNWDLTWTDVYDDLDPLPTHYNTVWADAWTYDFTQSAPLVQSLAYGYAGEDIPFTLVSILTQHFHYDRREDQTDNPDGLGADPNASAQAIDNIDHDSELFCTLSAPILGAIYSVHVTAADHLVRGCEIVPGAIDPGPAVGPQYITLHSDAAVAAFLAVRPERIRNAAATLNCLDDGTASLTMSVKTVDYIYADVDEGVFLAIEGEITNITVETYTPSSAPFTHAMPISMGDVRHAALPAPALTQAHTLTIKYVLTVRGTRTEWLVYDSTSFVKPTILMRSLSASIAPGGGSFGDAFYYAWQHDKYHLALQPPPIFNPAFMHQGNCPYIAYTTGIEESTGTPPATPEIYVDFRVQVEKYSTWAATNTTAASRYGGTVHFIPAQLLFAFRQYIGGESLTDGSLSQNTGLWETIFPAATPFAIQFCNGVKGAWSDKLGTGFAGSPAVEITRV